MRPIHSPGGAVLQSRIRWLRCASTFNVCSCYDNQLIKVLVNVVSFTMFLVVLFIFLLTPQLTSFFMQWECKTDMDNAYRFGTVNVNCEGYSSRDDPYVLRGSCGVSYVIITIVNLVYGSCFI